MSPKEESRQQILQAALLAFAENGYDKTSMDDIVQRSGLSKGSLYWHFKNKHDLFLATMDMVMVNMDFGLTELVEKSDTSAEARLRQLFEQVVEMMEADRSFVGLLANAFFQSYQNEDAREMMRTAYERYISKVQIIIQQGIDRGEFRATDPLLAAVSMMAGGDGIAFYMLMEPSWDLGAALLNHIDLVLHGLHKEKTET